jgi:YVTN family beta-propeller protein
MPPSCKAGLPAHLVRYVANFRDSSVTVIDGASHHTVFLAAGLGPFAIVANHMSDKVYVANMNDDIFGNSVTVIDGATNALCFLGVGHTPAALAVDAARNKIFVANLNDSSVTVIDGVTNATTTVPVGSNPIALAVDSLTNNVYVANLQSNTATVIQGATPALVPFFTSISIDSPSNLVTAIRGTAKLTGYSNLPPPSPPLKQTYCQSDTWQGIWQPITVVSQLANLSEGLGVHVLYAFATEGEEFDSTAVAHKVIGTIAAEAYVNILPSTLTAMSMRPGNSVAGQRVLLAVHESPSPSSPAGPSPTGTVMLLDNGIRLAVAPVARQNLMRRVKQPVPARFD